MRRGPRQRGEHPRFSIKVFWRLWGPAAGSVLSPRLGRDCSGSEGPSAQPPAVPGEHLPHGWGGQRGQAALLKPVGRV